MIAAGLPEPELAQELTEEVFGYAGWPRLMTQVGRTASIIVMLLGLMLVLIARRHAGVKHTARAVLQAGERQVAAGYVLYGSSVLMVLTTGAGVDMYVLDPVLGDFVLVKQQLQIPAAKKVYSINEAYRDDFPAGVQRYLDEAHASGYALRYIGSMVADVHRTLLKGGVFLYPPTAKAPDGKLRLMYEGNPMSLVIEQAGGASGTGAGRILELVPGELHQRCPVILGSPDEVERVLGYL